jgi:hypothetical protein
MKRQLACLIFLCVMISVPICEAQAPATTTISDTIYRADSTLAGGTLLISWPAFASARSVANKDIVDENKFRDGLSKVIDGVVDCLNASAWAKKA